VPNDPEGTPAKKTTRSRRGRRGGVGRKKPASAATNGAAATTAVPPVAAPARTDGTRATPVVPSRQRAVQEDPLQALKGMQSSLSAIENRLISMSRLVTERPRVGIFVDVPNVMYAAERERVKLDYSKVLAFLLRGRELVRASAYAPISDDPQVRLDTQRFVEPFMGEYRVMTKMLKRFADGSMKANFDVELAIDILTMSERLDTVTLVSGDGDFRRLVELVQSKGVRVEVAAFGNSTAAELRAIADEYIDLNDHLAELRLSK
jgi:uncharacterized LabA/DUF88 family protein